MNNKYLAHIAEIEHKPIEQYADIPANNMAYDMLISAAIFVALVLGVPLSEIAKEIEEPPDKVSVIYRNIQEAGYISKDGHITLNIEDTNDNKMVEREYHLFVLAGVGIIKKC